MRLAALLLTMACLSLLPPSSAGAEERVHVVRKGQTLLGIAKRYSVSVKAICRANGIRRDDMIREGQKLVIADKNDEPATPEQSSSQAKSSAPARPTSDPGGMNVLQVPRVGPAYYYEPTGPGRLGLRPVLMYMHGRGGQPKADCRRWAKVARPVGWLVCPSGPGAQGDGRGWNNNWLAARHAAVATVEAMREKFGRRVQLYGNTLIGFSEGAFVAMNIGIREPRTFNRWLILAGKDSYWGGSGVEELKQSHARVRRVYLITGERDEVIDGTRKVREWLRKYQIPTRITTPPALGHQVALNSKPELYRMALLWLQRGY